MNWRWVVIILGLTVFAGIATMFAAVWFAAKAIDIVVTPAIHRMIQH